MRWPAWAHFAALVIIFASSLWAFLRFEDSPTLQLYVVIAAVIAYDAWGMIYHYFRRRLTVDLVLEYLLVGALVILLFFWTLFS
ncbi:hypothetical protein A2890_01485 [candidate division WWE3 bacterium RIFCSPLOWO2_01_FULL_53_14]|uniref:Uncharacterized protein n=1 Tax=candidate division WWE3 bacterium RIFCSPLOWO2_01_FULL_53_14 TaxID=1802628 RepID=A0A1F4VSU9_UNCKA|nr:MAG: hypothetical protein A2890_01485 [candidate division WWE3 bacterium RIFCSPLOWO2_01_FULL_53_14]